MTKPRPLTVLPATVWSNSPPNGSSPKTPIQMGPACICCGQSTNLAKLYRNSAFTWYSSAACASDGVAKSARKHNPKVQTSQRVALALGTGHWDGRTRIARDLSEDASLSFRAGHRGRIAV